LLQEEGIPAGNQRWVNGIYRELEIFYDLVISHNHGNDLYKIGRAVGKRADPMQGDTAFKRGMATLLTWRAAVGREEALFPATGRHDKIASPNSLFPIQVFMNMSLFPYCT
jgi:hypothetical protein